MRPRDAIAVLAVLAASGCYSTQPYDYRGRDSNAVVVFYRLSDPNLGGLKAYVGVDGEYVVRLDNNAYAEIQLAPGKHTLAVAGYGFARRDSREVDVADLDRLYFEVDPNPSRWATVAVAGVEPVSSTVVESTSTRPFLLVSRTEQEFRDRLALLERREPKAK
jgi:hypothetical protein